MGAHPRDKGRLARVAKRHLFPRPDLAHPVAKPDVDKRKQRRSDKRDVEHFSLPLPNDRETCHAAGRSEEHTSELQSLMRISYAVFCLNNKTTLHQQNTKPTILTTTTK